MKFSSRSIVDGAQIADTFALAVPADEGHVSLARNINPHLTWADVPDATRSFVITCIDADCPSSPDSDTTVDTETLGLSPGFSRAQLLEAVDGHEFASDSITVGYALNPRLR